MFSELSDRAFTVPERTRIVTSVDLPHRIGAVSALVSDSPLSTSVTPVVPFLTLTEPSAQLPESTYVPAASIVTAVPSISAPLPPPLTPPSEKTSDTAFSAS